MASVKVGVEANTSLSYTYEDGTLYNIYTKTQEDTLRREGYQINKTLGQDLSKNKIFGSFGYYIDMHGILRNIKSRIEEQNLLRAGYEVLHKVQYIDYSSNNIVTEELSSCGTYIDENGNRRVAKNEIKLKREGFYINHSPIILYTSDIAIANPDLISTKYGFYIDEYGRQIAIESESMYRNISTAVKKIIIDGVEQIIPKYRICQKNVSYIYKRCIFKQFYSPTDIGFGSYYDQGVLYAVQSPEHARILKEMGYEIITGGDK